VPFDKLKALSVVEGLHYLYPSSLRRSGMHATLVGISQTLHPVPTGERHIINAFAFGGQTKG